MRLSLDVNIRVRSEVGQLHIHLGYTGVFTNIRIYLLVHILRVSRLKSPVINTLFILLSKARLIESSIRDKVVAREFGGL